MLQKIHIYRTHTYTHMYICYIFRSCCLKKAFKLHDRQVPLSNSKVYQTLKSKMYLFQTTLCICVTIQRCLNVGREELFSSNYLKAYLFNLVLIIIYLSLSLSFHDFSIFYVVICFNSMEYTQIEIENFHSKCSYKLLVLKSIFLFALLYSPFVLYLCQFIY